MELIDFAHDLQSLFASTLPLKWAHNKTHH